MNEKEERYQAALVDGYRAGYVKVHVTMGPDDTDFIAGESLWATRTDKPDEFVIDNCPFFAGGIAYKDRVRAYHPDDAANPNYFEFAAVAEPGGYVTLRAVGRPALIFQMEEAFGDDVSIERGYDGNDGETLFSIAVKRNKRLSVARWLTKRSILWEWGS